MSIKISEIYHRVSKINQQAYELLYKDNIPIFIRFEFLEVGVLSQELKEQLNQIAGFGEIHLEQHQRNLKNRLEISDLTDWISSSDKNPNGA